MVKTKEEFLKLLKIMTETIEKDDSFQGYLFYEVSGANDFEVEASFRVGNSEGQGGIIIIESEMHKKLRLVDAKVD